MTSGRVRLLDLFCGAGGAAMGYHRAGFEVVGVDIVPQPNYPFEFHRVGALGLLERLLYSSHEDDRWWYCVSDFAAIHASPPCQSYSTALSHLADWEPELIDVTRQYLRRSGLSWVIENVIGAPLPRQDTLDGRYGVELCGTMFGLRVYRHRLFETSFPIHAPASCRHAEPAMNPHNQAGRDRIYEEFGKQNPDPIWNEAMGVPWMDKHEGREAIPPAYTEFIGGRLMEHLNARAAA